MLPSTVRLTASLRPKTIWNDSPSIWQQALAFNTDKDTEVTRKLRDLHWKLIDTFIPIDQPNEGVTFKVNQDGADGNTFKGDCDDFAMTAGFVAHSYYGIPKEDIFYVVSKVITKRKITVGITQEDTAYHIFLLVRDGDDWYIVDNMNDKVLNLQDLASTGRQYEWEYIRDSKWSFIFPQQFVRKYLNGKETTGVSPTMP